MQELKENDIPLENIRICYSPFSRTTHTAKVVASVLNLSLEGPQAKVMQCKIYVIDYFTLYNIIVLNLYQNKFDYK